MIKKTIPKQKSNSPIDQNKLFNYIHPFDNDQFRDFSSQDLHQLLLLLDNYLLEYRTWLGISTNSSFGVEIELEKKLHCSFLTKDKISAIINYNSCNQDYDWLCIKDLSLGNNGIEITSPILRDIPEYWQDLYKCCIFLNTIGYIDEKCGGHIHIGAHLFNNDPEKWLRFLKIWTVYENIIFKFTNGSYINTRKGITKYAKPISKKTWEKIREIQSKQTPQINEAIFMLLKEYQQDKYQAVNFQHTNFTDRKRYGNTIEFRCPNGTLDPIIWQNNINLMLNIINFCLNNQLDEDLLFQRWQTLQNIAINNEIDYDEIYLEQALEFCDLVFTSNLDKLYFLKQYLKDYRTTYSHYFTKVPTFTLNNINISKIKTYPKP